MTSFQDVQVVLAILPSHRESTTLNAHREPDRLFLSIFPTGG